MTGRRARITAVVLLPLALAAACDSSDPAPPPATTTSSTPATTTSVNPATLAPRVTNPLKADRFTADPCSSLTSAQQQQFGIIRTDVDDDREGVGCRYGYPNWTPTASAVEYATKVSIGLSYRYAEHARGSYDYWQPTDVDGYPAVGYTATKPEDPGPDLCSFAIGLADTLFFSVTAEDKSGVARCSTAKDLASAVLANIKADQK
ncbi:DUF3558 domain-containing protein [Kibdelosporangium philippinense]|uniref:DUF3558 domain-containing protein n=1 Tax=Kibdelosporangium philippinense TaxID=211113 RepID=A0ABS8Z8A0_9PSEU|nr:DUF3558 family protein [Kibdelosporangium philippinense]MCE7004116.1 DUF3558 domain-containing protein [Kibdelosporangium philippinense]